MNGGHFEYNQYRIEEIANELENIVAKWKKNRGRVFTEEELYTNESIFSEYSKETIEEFQSASEILRTMSKVVHEIDYLLSGDTGEDTFHNRLQEIKDRFLTLRK